MSNATGAFGLRPVRKRNGSPYNGQLIECYVSSEYETALFVGDPVLFSPTLAEKDATGLRLTINKSPGTDGAIIHGVIDSFAPLVSDLSKTYNPASTERIAYVYPADRDTVFEVRGDGGGTPGAVFIGQNAILVASTSGNTTTGKSGMMLDEGTGTAPSADQSNPLLIVGIKNVEDNTLGDNAIYEVVINTAANALGDILGVTAS